MKKILFNIVLVLGVLYSCTEEKVEPYNSDRYVYFTKEQTDSLFYSFKFNPEKTEDLIPVELNLIGSFLSEDKEIDIKVRGEYSNTNMKLFELPPVIVFHKNKPIDTVYVKVFKPKIETDSVRVIFEIVENKNFLPGLKQNRQFKLIINDKLSRPEWWNDVIVNEFLGDYSDKKYELFIKITKESDLSNKDESEKRALALKFKYYLQKQKEVGNIILDEDENPMNVTVVG